MSKKHSDKSIKRGLNLLRFGWFWHNFLLIVPVGVLVYTQKGITVGDFFLIQGMFRLAAFLFEIPSGYLSDCFSRKYVMITGGIFAMFGFSELALANGFWTLVLGESLLGIASALFSGTLEAYTYDLMKRNKSQKHFLKEFGSITTYASTACFIAALLGGVLFVRIGGTNLLWLESLFMLISIVALLFLPDLIEVKRVVKHKTAIVDAANITYQTMKKPRLRHLILFPAIFGSFTIVLLWIIQPIMETSRVPVSLFGFYFGINQLSAILFAKYAYKVCEKLGEIRTSIITIGAIMLGITMGLLAIHSNDMIVIYIACAIMSVVPSIRMLNNLQYNTLIHHSIRSIERGTVLSTRAMVSTFCGAIFLILAKFLLDVFGIATTLVTLLIMTILLVWSLDKVSRYIKAK